MRFTNFHTTAVCSPTRACLLTGRNHHRVGMGMLPDLPTNFPGYYGRRSRGDAGTLAQILRGAGYATFCVGKWHLMPRDQRVTGPYDMWPTGLGFDRYYGFLNGETNQWTPNLVRDTNHVEPPCTPAEGYHLDADLADQAIDYLRELRLSHPDRPFLLWYASACTSRTAPGAAGVDRPVPRPVRRRAGTRGARQRSTARSRSGSFRPTPSCRSGRSGSSRGRRSTPSAAGSTPG